MKNQENQQTPEQAQVKPAPITESQSTGSWTELVIPTIMLATFLCGIPLTGIGLSLSEMSVESRASAIRDSFICLGPIGLLGLFAIALKPAKNQE